MKSHPITSHVGVRRDAQGISDSMWWLTLVVGMGALSGQVTFLVTNTASVTEEG